MAHYRGHLRRIWYVRRPSGKVNSSAWRGVGDSGSIMPGHGGFLDRLIRTACHAYCLDLCRNWPGNFKAECPAVRTFELTTNWSWPFIGKDTRPLPSLRCSSEPLTCFFWFFGNPSFGCTLHCWRSPYYSCSSSSLFQDTSVCWPYSMGRSSLRQTERWWWSKRMMWNILKTGACRCPFSWARPMCMNRVPFNGKWSTTNIIKGKYLVAWDPKIIHWVKAAFRGHPPG